jgi:hypothetical protein
MIRISHQSLENDTIQQFMVKRNPHPFVAEVVDLNRIFRIEEQIYEHFSSMEEQLLCRVGNRFFKDMPYECSDLKKMKESFKDDLLKLIEELN